MIKLLVSIDPARNRKRFYRVAVEATLLGDVCLTRSWGRIGGAEQRLAPLPVEDVGTAELLASRIVARQMRRGYVER